MGAHTQEIWVAVMAGGAGLLVGLWLGLGLCGRGLREARRELRVLAKENKESQAGVAAIGHGLREVRAAADRAIAAERDKAAVLVARLERAETAERAWQAEAEDRGAAHARAVNKLRKANALIDLLQARVRVLEDGRETVGHGD